LTPRNEYVVIGADVTLAHVHSLERLPDEGSASSRCPWRCAAWTPFPVRAFALLAGW